MKFDMHCHTKEGSVDASVKIEDYICELKRQGFDGMLVTDHDSYGGYEYWQKNIRGKKYKDFVVLRGVEYDTFDAGHIIVVMPEHVHLPVLEMRGLPINILIKLVHHYGGILGPAHPCGEQFLSMFSTGIFKKFRYIAYQFDFIEGFNSCQPFDSNEAARKLARQYKKPSFGGSDSHKFDNIGLAYTEFNADIRCESDLIWHIQNGGKVRCGGEEYHGTLKDKLGWWNIFLVKSFWFYNKFCAFQKRKGRRNELGEFRKLISEIRENRVWKDMD